MALASYGTPRYAERFRSLMRWREDGGTRSRRSTWPTCRPGPPPKAPLGAEHFDIASSLQVVLEEACCGWPTGSTTDRRARTFAWPAASRSTA